MNTSKEFERYWAQASDARDCPPECKRFAWRAWQAAQETEKERQKNAIEKAIASISCIYPSFGNALYDEVKDRLVHRIITELNKPEQKP